MTFIILLVIGLVEAGAIGGWLWLNSSKGAKKTDSGVQTLQDEIKKKEEAIAQINEATSAFIPFRSLHQKVAQLRSMKESVRVEKGRISITQAELETVEARLRELEEIDRELVASRLETEEEKKILERKDKEMRSKNDSLKEQIEKVSANLTALLPGLNLDDALKEELNTLKDRLGTSSEHTTKLLDDIESTISQYFLVKARYDALDIEYAQLYEKFADQEAQQSKEK